MTANSQPKTPKAPRRAKTGSIAPKAVSSHAFLTMTTDNKGLSSPSMLPQPTIPLSSAPLTPGLFDHCKSII